jgi:hypothetical protein
MTTVIKITRIAHPFLERPTAATADAAVPFLYRCQPARSVIVKVSHIIAQHSSSGYANGTEKNDANDCQPCRHVLSHDSLDNAAGHQQSARRVAGP